MYWIRDFNLHAYREGVGVFWPLLLISSQSVYLRMGTHARVCVCVCVYDYGKLSKVSNSQWRPPPPILATLCSCFLKHSPNRDHCRYKHELTGVGVYLFISSFGFQIQPTPPNFWKYHLCLY